MDDRSPAPLWLTVLLLAAFAFGAWQLLAQAPDLEQVGQISVLPGDRPMILGRAELGQDPGGRAADIDHLRPRHDATGRPGVPVVPAPLVPTLRRGNARQTLRVPGRVFEAMPPPVLQRRRR